MNTSTPFYIWQEQVKKRFNTLLKPSKKNEEWRYSDLHLLDKEKVSGVLTHSFSKNDQHTLLLDERLSQCKTLPTGVSVISHEDDQFKAKLDKFIQQNDFDKSVHTEHCSIIHPEPTSCISVESDE